MAIKYGHVAINQDLYNIIREIVKTNPNVKGITPYVRSLLLKDPLFLATCKKMGINPKAEQPKDIYCAECTRTFHTAHGFNIHLTRGSTCTGKNVTW